VYNEEWFNEASLLFRFWYENIVVEFGYTIPLVFLMRYSAML
jgi:hypothetical protein